MDSPCSLTRYFELNLFLKSHQKPPCDASIGNSKFSILRSAVHGGQAQSIAQAMVDDDNTDPVALWEGLEAYNDTAITRAQQSK